MHYSAESLEQIGTFLLLFVFWGGGLVNVLSWNTARRYLESKGFVNSSSLVLLVAILWQFIGATLVIVPYTADLGCFLLILFTILANLKFYSFWKMEGLERYINCIFFLSNIGVIGGLLLIWARIHELRFPLEVKIVELLF